MDSHPAGGDGDAVRPEEQVPTYIPVPRFGRPATYYELVQMGKAKIRLRRLESAGLLVGATAFHLLSIPFVLSTVKAVLELSTGRPVSLDELFIAEQGSLFWILVVGIALQSLFAIVALVGAGFLVRGRERAARFLVGIGVFAILFSLVVFGGIVAIIGGALSITGAVRATA